MSGRAIAAVLLAAGMAGTAGAAPRDEAAPLTLHYERPGARLVATQDGSCVIRTARR